MSNGLNNLKVLAEGMKQEIDSQNDQLDRIAGNAYYVTFNVMISLDFYYRKLFEIFFCSIIFSSIRFELFFKLKLNFFLQ